MRVNGRVLKHSNTVRLRSTQPKARASVSDWIKRFDNSAGPTTPVLAHSTKPRIKKLELLGTKTRQQLKTRSVSNRELISKKPEEPKKKPNNTKTRVLSKSKFKSLAAFGTSNVDYVIKEEHLLAAEDVVGSRCVFVDYNQFKPFYLNESVNIIIRSRDLYRRDIKVGGAKFFCTSKVDNAHGGHKSQHAVKDNGDGTYTIGWTPNKVGAHTISIRKDNEPIADSPFKVTVKKVPVSFSDASSFVCTVQGQGTKHGTLNVKSQFHVYIETNNGEPIDMDMEEFDVEILPPTNVPIKPQITGSKGFYTIEYMPKIIGSHTVDVLLFDSSVLRKKLKVPIYWPPDATKSMAHGSGLKKGVCGDPVSFHITSFDKHVIQRPVGGDKFDVSVSGPESHINVDIQDKRDGRYVVTYYPMKPGDYTIDVKLGDAHLSGSPFTSKVETMFLKYKLEGTGLKGGIKNTMVSFFVHIENDQGAVKIPATVFDVTITDEKGTEVDNRVVGREGSYLVEYIPHVTGMHTIDIAILGNSILQGDLIKSFIDVPPDETKTTVDGMGLFVAFVGQEASFKIIARDRNGKRRRGGGDPFVAEVNGPDGADTSMKMKDNNNGTYTVTYTPSKAGPHDITVSFFHKEPPVQIFKNSTLVLEACNE